MSRNGTRTRSYAVAWRDGGTDVRAGKLELDATGLRLEGSGRRRPLAAQRLRFSDIAAVRWAASHDRLGRSPTLLLQRRGGPPLLIAGVESAGALHELLDRLAPVVAGAASR